MPKISVIVPVYNTEKYLRRCVDSVLAQTFTDFELLLINDGSIDSSGAICDEYAQKDSRVRVFHKENGGVSHTRNLGLDNAQGEWITFVDSDDYLNVEAFENMLSNNGEDLVVCSYQEFGIGNRKNILDDNCYNRTSIIPKLVELIYDVAFMTPWGKLFKKDLINKNNLRFAEDICSGEDTIFVYTYLLYAKTIKTKRFIVYRYRITECGLSNQSLSIDKAILTLEYFQNVFDQIKEVYNKRIPYWKIINKIYRMALSYIMYNANNIKSRKTLLKQLHKSNLIRLYIRYDRQYPIGVKRRTWIFFAKYDMSLWILTIYSYFYCYD